MGRLSIGEHEEQLVHLLLHVIVQRKEIVTFLELPGLGTDVVLLRLVLENSVVKFRVDAG